MARAPRLSLTVSVLRGMGARAASFVLLAPTRLGARLTTALSAVPQGQPPGGDQTLWPAACVPLVTEG